MTTRRSFIKTTAMVSTGLLMAPKLFAFAKKRQIGTQLYTVRDAMAKDPLGTLAKVAQIGFNTVEGASYTGTELFYGMPAAQFKNVLNDNGLEMPSAHYVLGESMANAKGTLTKDWEKTVDDAAAVGLKYMVCAYLFDTERGSLDKLPQAMRPAGQDERFEGAGGQRRPPKLLDDAAEPVHPSGRWAGRNPLPVRGEAG